MWFKWFFTESAGNGLAHKMRVVYCVFNLSVIRFLGLNCVMKKLKKKIKRSLVYKEVEAQIVLLKMMYIGVFRGAV
tara:strand:- start:565 stop:792 length:228 start_codon:yes stop_codon:yes gene_type:complete